MLQSHCLIFAKSQWRMIIFPPEGYKVAVAWAQSTMTKVHSFRLEEISCMILPIRRKIYFFKHVYTSMYMDVSCVGTLKKSVEAPMEFPGAGVTGYEQHDVGVGN